MESSRAKPQASSASGGASSKIASENNKITSAQVSEIGAETNGLGEVPPQSFANTNKPTNDPQSTSAEHYSPSDESREQVSGNIINSNSIKQQQARLRDQFSYRSQSSPSSLTTHKFGLKPTPSPPRLIIDHQTGDIVESYPEEPVYLRTYQPLDSVASFASVGDDTDCDQSSSFPVAAQQQQQQQQTNPNNSDDDSSQATMSNTRRHQDPRGVVIPPPHSGKVYFAPPAGAPAPIFEAVDPTTCGPHQSQQQPQQAAPTHHFRRALNKLASEQPADVAIMTAEPAGDSVKRAPCSAQQLESPFRPPTGDRKSNLALVDPLAQQQQQEQQHAQQYRRLRRQKHQKSQSSGSFSSMNNSTTSQTNPAGLTSIEDFKLYNFCYNFRVLLVCLLSSLIIYLLCFPLQADCALYRPTQTYISLIVASVNLICVFVFTLFWYCNGVTRTLYANLSSSAFIITIYSILVGINLAIAILFFFINTCHFQRLVNTQLALSPYAAALQMPALDTASPHHHSNAHLIERSLVAGPALLMDDNDTGDEPVASPDTNTGDDDGMSFSSKPDSTGTESNSTQQSASGEDPPDEPEVESEEQHLQLQEYTMSPIEAAWIYILDQLAYVRRKVYRFVYKYDLKFIGALHALCAICFQFLAIKVAVVRSHYCAPVGYSD